MLEPVATMMAVREEVEYNEKVLVFHLGGCTLEASILHQNGSGSWYVEASEYKPFVGGCKID